MDEPGARGRRVLELAGRLDLGSRLARFEIDETTAHNLRLFEPVLAANIDRIIVHFYQHVERFPEAQAILKGQDVERLRQRQKRHWLRLLSGEFSDAYLEGALGVGLAHFAARVPAHVYIAAYSFFLGELLHLCVSRPGYDGQAISRSVSKAVMLDMSLSLNAYVLDTVSALRSPGQEPGDKTHYLPT